VWLVLAFGVFFLTLSGLQLWFGKTFIGYGIPGIPPWTTKRSTPLLFWTNAVGSGALGIFALALGLSRLL
jgi:hypothetical protein